MHRNLQASPVLVWRVLAKYHDVRNHSEYEGILDVDERLVTDLIITCQAVADTNRLSKAELILGTGMSKNFHEVKNTFVAADNSNRHPNTDFLYHRNGYPAFRCPKIL
ncbi:MAG: hypothetical protein ABW168_01815 [Sedimenticola sp.]